MEKFIIERLVEGAGQLSSEELQEISERSCNVLREMGPEIQWIESFVTDDKIYCVYLAENPGLLREHAQAGGFPADRISEVKKIIDPTTAAKAIA